MKTLRNHCFVASSLLLLMACQTTNISTERLYFPTSALENPCEGMVTFDDVMTDEYGPETRHSGFPVLRRPSQERAPINAWMSATLFLPERDGCVPIGAVVYEGDYENNQAHPEFQDYRQERERFIADMPRIVERHRNFLNLFLREPYEYKKREYGLEGDTYADYQINYLKSYPRYVLAALTGYVPTEEIDFYRFLATDTLVRDIFGCVSFYSTLCLPVGIESGYVQTQDWISSVQPDPFYNLYSDEELAENVRITKQSWQESYDSARADGRLSYASLIYEHSDTQIVEHGMQLLEEYDWQREIGYSTPCPGPSLPIWTADTFRQDDPIYTVTVIANALDWDLEKNYVVCLTFGSDVSVTAALLHANWTSDLLSGALQMHIRDLNGLSLKL